ncbi:MAG: menaquinone biosynthetic enzyme MqnA/MqnD family protein [Planctomycetota bacterium]
MTIRIGGVPYGVGAPLLVGLDENPAVELVREFPARLVDRLRAGQVDAALASSIEAFRRPGYLVAPHLCIACKGPARSVRMFRKPGDGPVKTVALDVGSETSVALLKILLNREMDLSGIRFRRIEPTTRLDELQDDLVLLIGNAGLTADPGGRQVTDLGEAWHQWAGLPFVFALWLIAPDADPDEVVPHLLAAHRRATQEEVSDGTQGAIYYQLGDEEHAGLRRFHIEAAELALADPQIEPIFIPNADSERNS